MAHYPIGGRGDGQWDTWGNSVQGVWGTGGIGHIGHRPMGNGGTGGKRYKGYGSHGQRDTGVWAMGPMSDLLPKYQKDVKLSKRCQVVKKMSNVKKSNT